MTSLKYRAEIDGLRAIAVLPVIFFHAGFEYFSGGYVGVDIFFVISGYLIATILIREIADSRFSLVNFYERRARRILPALFFVTATCIPFAWLWLTPSDLKDFGESLVSTVTFSSNILFWWERGYFGPALELKPLLHTWSLAVEEQFYIFFPPLLLIAWKLGIPRLTGLLVIIFLLSLTLAHFASVFGVYERVTSGAFYLFPTRIWELLAGVLAAIYLYGRKPPITNITNHVIGLLGLILIIFSILSFDHQTPFPSAYTILPVLGTVIIIIFGSGESTIARLLSYRPMVSMGLISYSAYLWHQPIFAFARHRFSEQISESFMLLLTLLSLCLAYASWRWIEAPFRSNSKFTQRTIFSASFMGVLILGAIGLILTVTDGLLSSRTEVERTVYKEFITLGKYSPVNMRLQHLQSFDDKNERKKLLVIGDSYAEDLVNAVVESNLASDYQLSTYRIPANCGVLFIERELISKYQPSSCYARPNFFNEPRIFEFLKEADEVWIASSWREWQIPFLGSSLQKLNEFNENITIFGTKSFDIRSPSDFKNKYGAQGLTKKFLITEQQRSLNMTLGEIAKTARVRYVDTMMVICGSTTVCQHSFDSMNILSVDGGHLTQYGARHFGLKLQETLSTNGNSD